MVNEAPGVGLVIRLLPNPLYFQGEEVLRFVEPGLYKKHRKRQ